MDKSSKTIDEWEWDTVISSAKKSGWCVVGDKIAIYKPRTTTLVLGKVIKTTQSPGRDAPPDEPTITESASSEGISEPLLDIDVCYDECGSSTVDCVKDFEKKGTIPKHCPQEHIFKKWSENPDRKESPT